MRDPRYLNVSVKVTMPPSLSTFTGYVLWQDDVLAVRRAVHDFRFRFLLLRARVHQQTKAFQVLVQCRSADVEILT